MSYFQQQPIPQTDIGLVSFKAFEVPGSNPVYYRPLQFDVSSSIIERVVDITRGGSNLSATALRNVAPEIVSPSRVPQGELGISHGFRSKRMAIFANFQIKTAGRIYNEVLSLYTDISDYSHGGHLNPQTLLFVNSHIRLAESTIAIPEANGLSRMGVMNNDNVVRPILVNTEMGQVQGQYTMRPSDLLAGWQRTNRPAATSYADPRGDIISQDVQCLGVASSRDNVSSTRMLTKTLNGWVNAVASNSGLSAGVSNMEDQTNWTIGNAIEAVAEDDLSSIQLFKRLRERTGYSQNGFMILSELFAAMDWVNDQGVEPVVPLNPTIQSLAGDTESWNNAANETNIAHKLSHGVPSIVTKNLMTAFSFRAYGDVDTNQHFVSYQGSAMMFQSNQSTDERLIGETILGLQNVIVPECVYGEANTYDIEVDYTMSGMCLSKISLNGMPHINYGLPNYCDSITSGTVATDNRALDAAGAQLGTLITGVVDSSNVTPAYYY